MMKRHLAWAVVLLSACGSARIEHASEQAFGDVRVGDSRRVAFVLTNSGDAEALLTFTVEGDFSVSETSRTMPAGETSRLLVDFTPSVLGPLTGTLFINGVPVALSGTGTESRFTVLLDPCIVLTPSTLDFGETKKGCASTLQVELDNTCTFPVVLDSVFMLAAAGAGPGAPNCRGPLPCPEFFFTSTRPTTLPPGPMTLSFEYRPIDDGADNGAFVITARGREHVISLTGRGRDGHHVDTFRDSPRPVIDVLVMVDASPSFESRRANTRSNMLPLLNQLNNGCFDVRWAFAAADGAPGAGVQLLPNDAGQRWTSSEEPFFAERALSAFDALPVGSEVEACIGPAADLIEDAGVRAGALFAGICVTDALEQTTNPMAALQRIQGQGRSSWSTISGIDGGCGVEAVDDGVHGSLVTASDGIQGDICDPNWGQSLQRYGSICGPRNAYYLNGRPDGAIEVRVNGQLLSENDWMYDSTNNAIHFAPGRTPAPGSTIEISYGGSCE